jgi:hypothetical protein
MAPKPFATALALVIGSTWKTGAVTMANQATALAIWLASAVDAAM